MSYTIETPQELLVQNLQERWGSLKDKPELTLEELEKTLSQTTEELSELEGIITSVKKNGKVSEGDIKDFRDLVVDMMFYLMQPIVCSGLTEQFKNDFYKIYLNNATKICKSFGEATETVSYYKDTQGIDCYISYVEDFSHYVVKRLEDHKVMKPLSFVPVELDD